MLLTGDLMPQDDKYFEYNPSAIDLSLPITDRAVGTTTSEFKSSSLFFNRTDAALPIDDMVGTVEYESRMFLETSELALDHWAELPGKVVQHAVVEDAVLHARCLCEIFLGSGEEDTISL